MLSQEKEDKIKALIKSDHVVLFMKGNTEEPRCGFSAQVVSILKHVGTSFTSVDILKDQELRDAMKEFSSWPTFPQLYVRGEFVGGYDIVCEMFEAKELEDILKGKTSSRPDA